MVGETVEGVPGTLLTFAIRRITVTVRRRWRDANPDPNEAANYAGRCCRFKVVSGPTMLKTENARPASWFMLMPAAGTWCRW